MKIIQKFWQNIAPVSLQAYIRFLLESKIYRDRRLAVLNHYKTVDPSLLDMEIREGLKYLKKNKFTAYPYYWTLKYDSWMPEVVKDESTQCYYSIYEGKKMFFPKKFSLKEVVWIIRSIYKEQDINSPHLYLTEQFKLNDRSIVIDAGVAEGNFALSVVEKAEFLYLVECDPEWMEALKMTFAPWREKVIFVEKFMSDSESATTISIDSLLKNTVGKDNYFIKMDIEGYEQLALSGMKNLVASGKQIKMDICTYHKAKDLVEIQSTLNKYGFKWHVSDSYILFCRPGDMPEFRKVLIRAEKM